MKILLVILLIVHGLIHLMGFIKALHPEKVKKLSVAITIPVGLAWLLAAILFLTTAFYFISGRDHWWMFALAAMLLSQVLILLSWKDARFGSLLNGLILIAAFIGYGNWNFRRDAAHELASLLSNQREVRPTLQSLEKLPQPIQRWLQRSGVTAATDAGAMYYIQSGEMRTAPDGKWLKFSARQWNTTQVPEFFWLAQVKVGPGIRLYGRDLYANGNGHMLIKALGLFTVANNRGAEINQGSLLRYLAELVWYPAGARQPYINWTEKDSSSAIATMAWKGITASGIFRFDSKGDVASFEANRFYDREDGATLERWLVTIDPQSFREFDGLRIPVRSEVTWKLKEGDFTWFRLVIKKAHYYGSLAGLPGI